MPAVIAVDLPDPSVWSNAEKKPCIALDAMGGDKGPVVAILSAVSVLEKHPSLRIVLVGDTLVFREKITHLLSHHSGFSKKWSRVVPQMAFLHASQVVTMEDSVGAAFRNKKDASMRVALECVKNGLAQACVSCGNTGALMTIARFVLKTIPGIERPAIIAAMPAANGHTHVLDLGANVDSSPEQLVQFALMGSLLVQLVEGIAAPKVALLNVGVEAHKGNELVKATAHRLAALRVLHYVGFVEGDDLYKGTVDVVVCDGFVGNVALKASEGLAKFLVAVLRQEFCRNPLRKLAAWFMRPLLRSVMRRLDPAEYNGATLIGLRGIVLKSHGSSDEKSLSCAIVRALREIEHNVPQQLEMRLASLLEHYRLGYATDEQAGSSV